MIKKSIWQIGIHLQLFQILLGMISFSCNNKQEIAQTSSKKIEPIIINIQPYKGFPQENIQFIYNELSKIYPNVVLNKTIELPIQAFYKPRKRYRADSLIKFLKTTTPKGHITMGLTNQDISTTKDNIVDYGIMGLGYQPGSSCVVSSFRLSKKNLLVQFFKVAVHELGHTQGLAHCRVKNCYMRDAEGKNYLEAETDFCRDCKQHLVSNGWRFKN